MMVKIQQWARRICAAAAVLGMVLTLLVPDHAQAQVVRLYAPCA